MKRTLLTLLTIATLVASVAACTPTELSQYDCLQTGRPIYDVPSNHSTPWPPVALQLANGTAIDARGETWDNTALNSSGYGIGVKVHYQAGSRDNLCMVGGIIRTTIEPEDTPWLTWHRVYGMFIETDNFTLVGTSFANQGDLITFSGAQNWKLIGVRAEGPAGSPGAYIHDDCIENDLMSTGLVDDSKFDGCNVFMSSNSTADGTGNVVQITNSLIRLQPYKNNYNTAKYGENTNGGFFKFASPTGGIPGTPPHLVVKNTVFRADQQGVFGGNSNGMLGLPPGTECDNVMLVGTEAWRVGDVASWTSQCTNLTFGSLADWNARVAVWDSEHPVL
jgi:hypothetical protein